MLSLPVTGYASFYCILPVTVSTAGLKKTGGGARRDAVRQRARLFAKMNFP
jgi:hypothetical protein